MPEAWLATQLFGRQVCVWDQAARIVYSFKPENLDGKQKTIHLGLHREHYVLLHHRPASTSIKKSFLGSARGGARKTLLKSRKEVEDARREQYRE